MKTLIINAHPDFKNRDHYSTALEDYFTEKLSLEQVDTEVTVLNLYEEDLPRIDERTFAIYRKNATGEDLTAEEAAIFNRSRELLAQFKEHHRLVISSPLHNFNVTSRLKDYLDNIMVAREVYQYTEDGSEGLMTDDYKVLYLQSSGSIYTNDDRYTPLEFSTQYLEAMFTNIMGFEAFYVARAQGADLGNADRDAILAQGQAEIDAVFEVFYMSK